MKIYIFTAGIAFILVILINLFTQIIQVTSKPIPPAPELAYAKAGYGPILADTHWLRLIQDLDYCGDNEIPLEQSLSPDGSRRGPNRTPSCNKGWAYSMLNLIFELDPRFHYAAQMGPISLSVVSDDIAGATAMFEKVTREYANDWVLHYQAGYHYMVELEEFEKASEYFLKSHFLGSPRWVPLLVARLQTKAGKKWLAESTLKNYIETVKDDPKLKAKAEKKLKASQNN